MTGRVTTRAHRERAAAFLFHHPDAPRVQAWVETGWAQGSVDFDADSQVGTLAAQFAAVEAEAYERAAKACEAVASRANDQNDAASATAEECARDVRALKERR